MIEDSSVAARPQEHWAAAESLGCERNSNRRDRALSSWTSWATQECRVSGYHGNRGGMVLVHVT
eukprot:85033-Prymnesium_polylepis.1